MEGSRAFLGATLVRRMDSLSDTALMTDAQRKASELEDRRQRILFYGCDRRTHIQVDQKRPQAIEAGVQIPLLEMQSRKTSGDAEGPEDLLEREDKLPPQFDVVC